MSQLPMPASMVGSSVDSSPSVFCKWDWCTARHSSRDALHEHVLRDHVRTERRYRADEVRVWEQVGGVMVGEERGMSTLMGGETFSTPSDGLGGSRYQSQAQGQSQTAQSSAGGPSMGPPQPVIPQPGGIDPSTTIVEEDLLRFIRSPTVDQVGRMGGATGVVDTEALGAAPDEAEAGADTSRHTSGTTASQPLPPNQQAWRVATGVVSSTAGSGGGGVSGGISVHPTPPSSGPDTTRSSHTTTSSHPVPPASAPASAPPLSSGAPPGSSQPSSTPLRALGFGGPSGLGTPSRIFAPPLTHPIGSPLGSPSAGAGGSQGGEAHGEGVDGQGKRKASTSEIDLGLGRARKAMRYSFGGTG